MSVDLAAYLQRVGLAARPSPDAAGLAAVQRAHRLAIPFENLDVRLGRGIDLAPDAVFYKLVTARRGGYCFEHDRLFRDVLAAIGLAAQPLLARVWLNADDTPPLTHALSLVTIDGAAWIADPGFGGSYAPVMPLVDGAEADAPDGARFRLERDAALGWVLSRDGAAGSTDGRGGGAGWRRQYSFTLDPVADADLAAANRFVSTDPAARQVRHVLISLPLPHGFASLTDRDYRRRAGIDETAATIDDPRVYRLRLSLMFGIDLSRDEVAALGLF